MRNGTMGFWNRCAAAGACLFVLIAAGPARALDVDGGALVNWSCLNLSIGFCVCGVPPQPCLRISYNEPRLLIHTWATAAGKPGHESPQQFNEATAVPFPLALLFSFFSFACSIDWSDPSNSTSSTTEMFSVGAVYSSLVDRVAWRTGAVELWAAQSIASAVRDSLGACAFQGLAGQLGITIPGLGEVCMGNWGPLFARTGWLMHPSEPVGSAAAAYRAAHILSHPEFLAGHVVPMPATDFRASTADLLQLAVPRLTSCFQPGTPPILWEQATTSPVGQYVWVYWVRRSCCVPPSALAGAVVTAPRTIRMTRTPQLPAGAMRAASAEVCRIEPIGWSRIPAPAAAREPRGTPVRLARRTVPQRDPGSTDRILRP